MGQKRNDYLDISDEEDAAISDTEFREEGRFSRIQQSAGKRRKLSNASDDSDESISGNQKSLENSNNTKDTTRTNKTRDKTGHDLLPTQENSAPVLKLSDAHQKRRKKTGVIYLSRIPPFMKPTALRHLLAPHGTLLRIFLTPEPAPSYTKRVKSGGNKKRSFVDGWVEFASKTKAKMCAETLNGTIIGGKKGSWYHDDIWNIKYLKGFKWDDLMEQVQDEKRIRQEKQRAEIQQETKERRFYEENVEQDKIERTREAKRKKLIDAGIQEVELQGKDATEGRFLGRQNKVMTRGNEAAIGDGDGFASVDKIF